MAFGARPQIFNFTFRQFLPSRPINEKLFSLVMDDLRHAPICVLFFLLSHNRNSNQAHIPYMRRINELTLANGECSLFYN